MIRCVANLFLRAYKIFYILFLNSDPYENKYCRPWHVVATMRLVLGFWEIYYPSVLDSFHVDISNLREREGLLWLRVQVTVPHAVEVTGQDLEGTGDIDLQSRDNLEYALPPSSLFSSVYIPKTESGNGVAHSGQLFPFQRMQSRLTPDRHA